MHRVLRNRHRRLLRYDLAGFDCGGMYEIVWGFMILRHYKVEGIEHRGEHGKRDVILGTRRWRLVVFIFVYFNMLAYGSSLSLMRFYQLFTSRIQAYPR